MIRILYITFILLLLCNSAFAATMVATGSRNANLASFDSTVINFMQQRGIPGGALAVVKDGHLVYARGYGYADLDKHIRVQPTSLFRIASLSKMITAAAILKLVQQHRLKLDDSAFRILKLKPLKGDTVDPRLLKITVRQLLQHTGGFDRDASIDPMFKPYEIAHVVGSNPPANATDIIRYMMGRPLDFDPGTQYAYSNFGYCVLGRIIEKLSGLSYENYVRKYVLNPLGIHDMRLGKTAREKAAPKEVRYYQPDDGAVDSVYPGSGQVPYCYGGFNLESMDSHGGWIASAVDMARFASNVDGLFPKKIDNEMYRRPPTSVSYGADFDRDGVYYGFGWNIRPVGERFNYWHEGSLPGTFTLLVRRCDGLTWVVLFNQRAIRGGVSDDDIDPALHIAADWVKTWPKIDLFKKY